MQYVLAVADELHFGRAAENLRVAQPSLSRQIRELERHLGVELFARTSRRVTLTPAGAQFVEVARRAVRTAEAAEETARAVASGQTGRVALGFVASAAVELIPPIIAQHQSLWPGVRLQLRELGSALQLEALAAGEIDIGITRDLGDHPGTVVTSLFREPLVAVVPAEHPLHSRRVVAVRDLEGEDFVSLPRELTPRSRRLLSAIELRSGSEVNIAQEAQQYVTILALVAAGLGVAVVPQSVCALRQHGVRYLKLRDAEAFSEVQLVQRSDETQQAALHMRAVIIDILRRAE